MPVPWYKKNELIDYLKFPDFCISHGCRNALPLGQKDTIFTVFAMKTAKPYFIIP
jgi:hypothetical protein